MQKALPSEVVLVLGMHRSGTSALTRTLNILGLSVPKTLIKDNSSNVTGHWESMPLSQLNDEFLQLADLTWKDWKLGNVDRIKAKQRQNFHKDLRALLRSEFPGGRPCALKEPRISRIANEYLDFFQEEEIPVRVIIPVRNPLEVIQSLEARNAMDRLDSGLLWLRNVVEAVHATSNLKRAFVAYDEFLERPADMLASAAKVLDFEFPVSPSLVTAEIQRFVNSDLRHHVFESIDVAHDPVTQDWINDAYLALRLLCNDPENETALETLSGIKSRLDSADSLLEIMTANSRQRERNLRADTKRQIQKTEATEAELSELRTELEATYERLQASEAAQTSLRGDLGVNQEKLQTTEGELALARDELNATYDKLQSSDAELASARDELTTTYDKLQSSDAELASARDELATTHEKLQSFDAELASAHDELSSTYDKLQTSDSKLSAVREEFDSTYNKLQSSNAELASVRDELTTTYDRLQNAEVEVDSIQGELKSTYDKLQSSENELNGARAELSSAYDKLQTSKADLGALNGELSATYEKLQSSENELVSTQKALAASNGDVANMFEIQEIKRREMERLQLDSSRLEEEIDVLRGVIEVFKNSTSWRMTSPLRGVIKLMRGVKPGS